MTKKNILVVDDEEDILELVRYNLNLAGHEVLCAETGEQALDIARSVKQDLIILDLMLPGINGMEVARILKNDKNTCGVPIIMLTAKGEEQDVVTGLELGADDYVTKPFSPKILNARVQAVIRRQEDKEPGNVENVMPGDSRESIVIEDLVIHPGRHKVEIAGKEIELSFTEFQILLFLSKRPGWVFTRYQIVDAVHGDNYPVTERSVDVQIAGLRKKLGKCGRYIETVRGVGYRFKELKSYS
ncbi:Two component system response regulator, DNA-binding domain-containing [Desulfonema limicola]|uniref:Two component system response regulator, DNA-binding domain-containing n=1 Tax=Desulfonema limicola TaxID=45656 RepID=A0A975BBD3_9BACT|nr:response regulator [Desulfonema limicola]QTA82134.1 Two component system response regulator, DNA-binding domain-containing [Desulfonema limicola]